MPGVAACRSKKSGGRFSQQASSKNIKSVSAVFEEDPSKFLARVVANRGSYFQLAFHDGAALDESILLGSPCGSFGARGKIRLRIGVGDVVVVEGCERFADAKMRGKQLIVDITGKLSKKESQILFRAGRIHRSLYRPDGAAADDGLDDLFDNDDLDSLDGDSEDEMDGPQKQRAVKSGKHGVVVVQAKKGGKDRTAALHLRQDTAGSGGKTIAKTKQLKEELDATDYASAAAFAGGGAADDEDEFGHALRAASKVKKNMAVAAPAAAVASASAKGTVYVEEAAEANEEDSHAAIWSNRGGVPDTWEDDAVDIDAI